MKTSKRYRLFFLFLIFFFLILAFNAQSQSVKEESVQPYPKEAESRFLQANQAFKSKKWDQSLYMYQQLAEEFPAITAAQVGIGLSAAKLENFPLALEAFHQVVELMPNATGVQGELADVYRKIQRFDQAEKWYLKAIKGTKSKAPVAWYIGLGLLETERGNHDKAVQHYIMAINLHPTSTVAYHNLGTILIKLNRFDEADDYFDAALELDSNMASALFGKGQVCSKRRNFVAARDYYLRAIELSPEIPNFHHSLAQVFFRLNNHEEGQKHLAAYKRNKAKLHFNEGRQMIMKSDWNGALVRLQKAEETDPTYTDTKRYLAYVKMNLGDYDSAKKGYEYVLGIDPGDYLSLYYLGMTEIALGQLKSAEQSFLRVIKLVPEYQDCYLELGDLRRKTGDLTGAESAYTMGISQNGSWAPGYLWRGRLRYENDDLEGAEEDFRTSIRLAPTIAAPQYSLACLLVRTGEDLNQALKWSKSAVNLESAPEYQSLLASIYFRQGKFQLAKAEIEHAYQKDPENPDIVAWRNRIHQQLNKNK